MLANNLLYLRLTAFKKKINQYSICLGTYLRLLKKYYASFGQSGKPIKYLFDNIYSVKLLVKN